MWRELIRDCHPAFEAFPGADHGPEFFPGATPDALAEAERLLNVRFPESLRQLLFETDGALVCYGSHLVWPVDEIVQRNLEYRGPRFQANYMPLDSLLFFGDIDGSPHGFGIIQDVVQREYIYQWGQICDEREWMATSLRAYIEGTLRGQPGA